MPTRKKRAAIYVRESDVTLADSTTIESAVKACKDHCEKEKYLLLPQHQYKEAISAYMVPYFQRPQLMAILAAAKRQKRDAEALIYDIEEDQEELAIIETEIMKFEEWAEQVRPFLGNATYEPTYEEKRLAVRILGLKATVYPAKGDYPFRVQFEVAPPAILSKIRYCVQVVQSRMSWGQTECSTGKSGETL